MLFKLKLNFKKFKEFNELLKKDVENHKQMSILFDGYPRKLDQAEFLDSVISKSGGSLNQTEVTHG